MERLLCVELAQLCTVAPKPSPEKLREAELQRQVDEAMRKASYGDIDKATDGEGDDVEEKGTGAP